MSVELNLNFKLNLLSRYLNIFYGSVLLIGAVIWTLNDRLGSRVESFYGFAENKETEINFNYDVAVGEIYVQPGQRVAAGEKLLDMYRIRAKETLRDEPFRIAELRAKERIWESEQQNELLEVEDRRRRAVAEIDTKIAAAERDLQFQQNLLDAVGTTSDSVTYRPLTERLAELRAERSRFDQTYDLQRKGIEEALRLGKNPYRLERERLVAEQQFAEANERIELSLTAPHDGVVGNIYCKEGEHIRQFTTLISFYEPNPTLVEGYVQEDMILRVGMGEPFRVRSTKDPELIVEGRVTGLGSRIVEIPERLRKIADLKTYGREILVSIPAENTFLQKEKVILEFSGQ